MRLKREASIGISAIIGLQIVLSALAIALLTRMGPAIDHILEDNVRSEQAVEEMIAIYATTELPSEVPQSFEEAFLRAKNNITLNGERELIDQVSALKQPAFLNNTAAKRELIRKLQSIGLANREAMEDANNNAKAMSEAGAWAAAVLGALALAFGIAAYRRLLLRIEHPIDSILATFIRIHGGNQQARCNTGVAPTEIEQIGKELNWVVDQWQKALSRKAVANVPSYDEGVSRRLLCAVVDQIDKPLVIHDNQGNQIAANYLALGADTSDWIERPLLKSSYTFLLPPNVAYNDKTFVKTLGEQDHMGKVEVSDAEKFQLNQKEEINEQKDEKDADPEETENQVAKKNSP